MPTLDSVLNVVIPTTLILIVVAFIWIKTPLGAWLGPIFGRLWLSLKGEQKNKVIVYE